MFTGHELLLIFLRMRYARSQRGGCESFLLLLVIVPALQAFFSELCPRESCLLRDAARGRILPAEPEGNAIKSRRAVKGVVFLDKGESLLQGSFGVIF
jgi:hypothetical protein